MDANTAVQIIKQKFMDAGGEVRIPLQKNKNFTAQADNEGIKVSNLGATPLLPWSVFKETISLISYKGGRALRGDAMNCRLGDKGLPLDSIEGHIAHVVYAKQPGISITRRISPIAGILIWAGLCRPEPGELILIE